MSQKVSLQGSGGKSTKGTPFTQQAPKASGGEVKRAPSKQPSLKASSQASGGESKGTPSSPLSISPKVNPPRVGSRKISGSEPTQPTRQESPGTQTPKETAAMLQIPGTGVGDFPRNLTHAAIGDHAHLRQPVSPSSARSAHGGSVKGSVRVGSHKSDFNTPLRGENPNDLLMRLFSMWPEQLTASYRHNVSARYDSAENNLRFIKELYPPIPHESKAGHLGRAKAAGIVVETVYHLGKKVTYSHVTRDMFARAMKG